jgi:hypothetical protein
MPRSMAASVSNMVGVHRDNYGNGYTYNAAHGETHSS